MIKGIGIDNVELSRIIKADQHSARFAKKLLTDQEFLKLDRLNTSTQRAEFLAGAWAAKEAFSKALGTGIGPEFQMRDVGVANDFKGKPYLVGHSLASQAHLSITHSNLEAQAIVILESV